MKCQKCNFDFLEREIQESHDVPCYIFPGLDRKERKKLADKEGRHWLCKKCHDIYEKMVFSAMVKNITDNDRFSMIQLAKEFSKSYFNGVHIDGY